MTADPPSRLRGSQLALPAALAAAVLLAACGGGKKGAEATAVKITASQPTSGQYRIDAPASVKGGLVKIEFHNADTVVREAQLIRIDGAHTIDEFINNKGGSPAWLYVAGGVGTTQPGQTSTTIQALRPGRYYVIDTNSGKGQRAPKYYRKGAFAPLQVTGAGKGGGLPHAQATITITDRAPGFLATGLKAGSNTVLIDNTSSRFNGVAVIPILPGKTLGDVQTYFKSGRSGPSPLDRESTVYTATLEGSRPEVTRQVAQLDLQPGTYALTSYYQDARGTSAADRGWVAEVEVPPGGGSAGLPRDQLIRRANAICADAGKAPAAAYAAEKNPLLKTAAPLLASNLRAPDDIAKLQALVPRPAEKVAWNRWLAAERRLLNTNRRFAKSLERGSTIAAARTAQRSTAKAGADASVAAKAVGLDVCAKRGLQVRVALSR